MVWLSATRETAPRASARTARIDARRERVRSTARSCTFGTVEFATSPSMTLSTGTRLGSYEILSPLGAGAMGEVYRARDDRLRRDVAIKVLPREVSMDR